MNLQKPRKMPNVSKIRLAKLSSHKNFSCPIRDPLKWRLQITVANRDLHHSEPHQHKTKHCSFFAESGCLLFGHFCSKIYFTPETFAKKYFPAEENFQTPYAKINCRKNMQFSDYESHCSIFDLSNEIFIWKCECFDHSILSYMQC